MSKSTRTEIVKQHSRSSALVAIIQKGSKMWINCEFNITEEQMNLFFRKLVDPEGKQ